MVRIEITHAKKTLDNVITILKLNSQYNWGDKSIWPFDEHNNLHLDKQIDIHMSSKNYEESGNDLDLDLLTISY